MLLSSYYLVKFLFLGLSDAVQSVLLLLNLGQVLSALVIAHGDRVL